MNQRISQAQILFCKSDYYPGDGNILSLPFIDLASIITILNASECLPNLFLLFFAYRCKLFPLFKPLFIFMHVIIIFVRSKLFLSIWFVVQFKTVRI